MYETGKLVELNINDVLPNRFQPRIYFNDEKLYQLAESIHKYGVIQPIVVRQVNNKFEIIAGERRYKASKLANRATIPAIIVKLTDRESEEIALLENIQRQELTPIEEAVSYKRILDMGYITQEALAKKIGKSQSTIANKVRLLNLDDVVQEALLNGKISERHARSLLKINSRAKQREMLNRIINERLTVKRTDEEISKLLSSMPKETIVQTAKPSPELAVNSFTTGPVEMLFDTEENRKDGFMDIDKTLREAKDINADNQNNQLPGQNPTAQVFTQNIAQPNNQNATTSVETPSVAIPENDNKFVHYIPKEETPANETTQANPNATFNSIFNPTINDIAAVTPTPTPVVPTPETITPTPMPSVESAPMPEAMQTPVQTSVAPEPIQTPMQPVETTLPQTEFEQAMENIEPVSIFGSGMQNVSQPEVNNVAPSIPVVEESAPIANNQVPINENIQPITASPADYKIPQQNSIASAVSAAFAAKENSQVETNNVSPWGQTETNFNSTGEETTYTTPIEQNTFNIPKEDIFEEAETPTMNMQPSINPMPNMTSNLQNTNFREAIRLIRECADKIEALGYSLNVDEADLNDKYQVTFNINK